MTNKLFKKLAVVVCAVGMFAGLSTNAAAVTITFDSMAGDAQPHTESGYEFNATNFGAVRPTNFLNGSFTGNISAFPSFGFDDHGIVMTRSGGGEFDLSSFDLGEPFSLQSFPGASNFRITGTRADTSQITTTFLVDGIAGFQTFNPVGFTGLVSLLFQSDGTASADENRSLDNIVVTASTTAVAEPPLYMVLGLGLIALAYSRRR